MTHFHIEMLLLVSISAGQQQQQDPVHLWQRRKSRIGADGEIVADDTPGSPTAPGFGRRKSTLLDFTPLLGTFLSELMSFFVFLCFFLSFWKLYSNLFCAFTERQSSASSDIEFVDTLDASRKRRQV
jgi:hypothetical protein